MRGENIVEIYAVPSSWQSSGGRRFRRLAAGVTNGSVFDVDRCARTARIKPPPRRSVGPGTMRVWLPTGSIDSQNGSRGWPDPGPIVESGARWIFQDVSNDLCERLTIADQVVEIFALPEVSAT